MDRGLPDCRTRAKSDVKRVNPALRELHLFHGDRPLSDKHSDNLTNVLEYVERGFLAGASSRSRIPLHSKRLAFDVWLISAGSWTGADSTRLGCEGLLALELLLATVKIGRS